MVLFPQNPNLNEICFFGHRARNDADIRPPGQVKTLTLHIISILTNFTCFQSAFSVQEITYDFPSLERICPWKKFLIISGNFCRLEGAKNELTNQN